MAVATGDNSSVEGFPGAVGANATSTAETVRGALAQAQSTATGPRADATSTANSGGSGAAVAGATAVGSAGFAIDNLSSNATAMATASAAGGGTAAANAAATGGVGGLGGGVAGTVGAANATSTAEAVRGALAQAQSTAIGSSGQAQSTAKTNLAGVSVQSAAVAPTGGGTGTTNAIAQGDGGQAFANPGQTAYAFSTALPNKAYATTLIDGASHVASALLGPRDAVIGTAILGANYAADGGGASNTYSASATFDFADRGDLKLGLIDNQENGFAGGSAFNRWNSPSSPTASKFSTRHSEASQSPRVSSAMTSSISARTSGRASI
jgi:trimeric autotransporter adhesin